MKVHSHYDNLKVSRDAPQEIIRAAYKALSQKYHPDRRPDDPDAERIMKIINASYATLSDPEQRKEHDAWLARKEREASAGQTAPHQRSQSQSQPAGQQATPRAAAPDVGAAGPTQRPANAASYPQKTAVSGWRLIDGKPGIPPTAWALLFAACAVFAYLALAGLPGSPAPYTAQPGSAFALAGTQAANLAPSSQTESETQPWQPGAPAGSLNPPQPSGTLQRPPLAPNGLPWPTRAGYLDGVAVGNAEGNSALTLDNSNNAFDVFAKLVSTDGTSDMAVREFFIPAGERFMMTGITQGEYDVRYKNLDTGNIYKSQTFDLSEHLSESGIEYSDVHITLYTVPGGNMRPAPISEAQF